MPERASAHVSVQTTEQDCDISLAQPKRDSLRIAFHVRPRSQLIIEHTTGIRATEPK